MEVALKNMLSILKWPSLGQLGTRIRAMTALLREARRVRLGSIEPFEIKEIRGFLLEADKQVLSRYTRSLPTGATIVEIGSFLGLSAAIMSAARRDCKLVCIDPCDLSGDEESLASYRAQGFNGARQYKRLRLNLALYGANARVIRATSQEALKRFSTKCHLLFVDGDHSYEACARDINSYAPYLHEFGTLILHDATEIGWPGPIKVARELRECDDWELLEEDGNCVVFRKCRVEVQTVDRLRSVG
jgi:Methyltransferase domain